jgi:cytoskeletal protein RodZ
MGLILLEALLALVILVGIVWWTMFSGRQKGELPDTTPKDQQPPSDGSKG